MIQGAADEIDFEAADFVVEIHAVRDVDSGGGAGAGARDGASGLTVGDFRGAGTRG